MPDFPTAVPDIADSSLSETLFTMHGNVGHVPATNRILLNLRQLAGKIGIGASTPSGPGVLRQAGAAGSTLWGLLQNADIANAVITAAKMDPAGAISRVLSASAGGAVGWNQVTDAMLAGAIAVAKIGAGGAAHRVALTTDGVTTTWGTLDSQMVGVNALNASSIFGGGAGNRVLRTQDGTNAIWGQVAAADLAAGAVGLLPGISLPGTISTSSSVPTPLTGAALDWTATARPALVIVSFRDVTAAAALTWTVQLYDAAALVTTMLTDTIPDTATHKNLTAVFYTPSLGSGAKHHSLLWNVSGASAVNVVGAVNFAILELH